MLCEEMWINRQIDHPNVVRFIEAQEDKNFLYLVFEFMEGGELLDLVDSLGKFTEVQSRKIISGLADAVVHCHKQGVVHRDIKLENLLFTSRDEADRKVKLTDFGISRVLTAG